MKEGVLATDLRATFHKADDVGTVHRAAEELTRTIHNLSLTSDDPSVAGYQTKHRTPGHHGGTGEDRKRRGAAIDDILLQAALDQHMAELRERIEWLDVRIAQLRSDMEILSERIAKSRQRAAGISDALDELRTAGALETDSSGRPVNESALAAVEAYEKRTGRRVDVTNTYALEQALIDQQRFEERLQHDLAEQHEQAQEKHDEYEAERDQKSAELEALERGDADAITAFTSEANGPVSDGAALFNELAGVTSARTGSPAIDEEIERDGAAPESGPPGP